MCAFEKRKKNQTSICAYLQLADFAQFLLYFLSLSSSLYSVNVKNVVVVVVIFLLSFSFSFAFGSIVLCRSSSVGGIQFHHHPHLPQRANRLRAHVLGRSKRCGEIPCQRPIAGGEAQSEQIRLERGEGKG
jgi:hypothetical protein